MPKRLIAAAAALFSALLSTLPAWAVLQPTPGGRAIPVLTAGAECGEQNVELCLDQSEGDALRIDAQADALVAPEVFSPSCALTFTPLAKGGGDHLAFGWYNIKPDATRPGAFVRPRQDELYGMFVLAVGNTRGPALTNMFPPVQLNLAAEAAAGRYQGGAIGFWLAGAGDLSDLKLDPTTHALTGPALSRVFYTQHALNPGSGPTSTYYQVLTWQSVTFPSAFYFGWEDLVASADTDNDFDDLVFLVSGIQCVGGGEACDTGKLGVCEDGTRQCQKGELGCIQNVQPSAERCNALDDDCNGQVDDGADLCGAGQVCDRGRCVPKCGTGEFRCASDLVCTSRGVCVEPACATKDCPVGQVCHDGACVDGCMGVVCPHSQVCRNGACVDPCQNILCDDGFTCVEGVCQSCECSGCAAGKVCGGAKVCVDAGCESQTCAPGSHCSLGVCVDACVDAACPRGQLCQAGECVSDPHLGAGGGGGISGADSFGGNITIKPNPNPSPTAGKSAGSDDQGMQADRAAGAQSGCGCKTVGRPGRLGLLGAVGVGAGLCLLRRRRARRAENRALGGRNGRLQWVRGASS